MSYWKNETCEHCEGKLVEQIIDTPRKVGRRYYLFRHVPVGVCEECGMKYYSANVLKLMTQSQRNVSQKQIAMSVVNF